MISRLDPNDEMAFTGYYDNEAASNKKILRNVFVKGDMYFRTGDLITLDKLGYYYFGDRLGDTFRWKSENVATTEVSLAVSEYPGIADANVYGILVPNHEGRAGMVAIVLKPDTPTLDFADFYQFLKKRLPHYAVPLFIRIEDSLSTTQTFKQQKVNLRNEGIDPSKVKEQVYWVQNKTYVPFNKEDYARITRGDMKL